MKKIICDRCGKEIKPAALEGLNDALKALNSINYKLASYGLASCDARIYDLCRDCQNDLYNWLNGDQEEEK